MLALSEVHLVLSVLLFTSNLKLQPLLRAAFGADYQVLAESSPDAIPVQLEKHAFDVCLIDVDSDILTIEKYIEVHTLVNNAGVASAVMVEDSGRAVAMELMERGSHAYCRKPPAMRELKALVRRACEHTMMKRELKGNRGRSPLGEDSLFACDKLIGSSSSMCSVYDLVRRVAPLKASVLITGESGTGKELIARAIHNLGPRKHQPFVAVSCGAIPETLIESELFGHTKGSFTGSVGTHNGFFEQAGSGTLFLDEIGELSQQTQVKLLRVLQQKEFCRLGGTGMIPLQARVVFATHRDLPALIQQGKFRLDLYYRINVMTIRAPALGERPEDIGPLAQHFVRYYSEMYEKYIASISPSALRSLEDYDWPGNVRELENAIQTAIIRADSNEIQVSDLPENLKPISNLRSIDADVPNGTFDRLIRDYKVKLTLKAIEECHGNKTLAARSLDISRGYLHRLLRAEDIEATDAA
jgi:DNA-binding NtrC family response regulator